MNYRHQDYISNCTHLLLGYYAKNEYGLTGRMGIVYYLFIIGKEYENSSLTNCAEKLLDNLICDFAYINDWNFNSGLAGVGWMLQELLRRGILCGNANEVLADFDQAISNIDLAKEDNKSFLYGSGGIIAYVKNRYSYCNSFGLECPFSELYIDSVNGFSASCDYSHNIRPECGEDINQYILDYVYHINSLDKKARLSLCLGNKPISVILYSDGTGKDYGVGRYLSVLSDGLCKNGWNCVLIKFFSRKSEFLIQKEDDNYILEFPLLQCYGNIDKYMETIGLACNMLFSEYEKVVFHINSIFILGIARYLKVFRNFRVIYTSHTELRLESAFISKVKNAIPLIDAFIVPSEGSNTITSYKALGGKNLNIIPHPLSLSPSGRNRSKEYLRTLYNISPSEFVILYAGRLAMEKGIFHLLKAFGKIVKHYDNLRLIIAGDGAFSECMKISEGFFSKVTYIGKVNERTLSRLMQCSDLGVVPSLNEEFGYTALEMAYYSLPTLVSDVGGLKDSITNLDGFYFVFELDKRHPDKNLFNALQSNIRYLQMNNTVKNKKKIRRLINKHYSNKTFISKMLRIYLNSPNYN